MVKQSRNGGETYDVLVPRPGQQTSAMRMMGGLIGTAIAASAGSAFASCEPGNAFQTAAVDRASGGIVAGLEARARRGDGSAMRELGIMYREGKGVRQDWVAADKWFNLASSRIKEAARERDAAAQCLSTQDLMRAQADATGWLMATPQLGAAPAPPRQ